VRVEGIGSVRLLDLVDTMRGRGRAKLSRKKQGQEGERQEVKCLGLDLLDPAQAQFQRRHALCAYVYMVSVCCVSGA